jgi:hypothetical protein
MGMAMRKLQTGQERGNAEAVNLRPEPLGPGPMNALDRWL